MIAGIACEARMLRLRNLCALMLANPAFAQFDLGFSAAAYDFNIEARKSEGHAQAYFSEISTPAYGFSITYSERRSEHADITFALEFTRKSFHASYSNGGLGGGTSTAEHVDLDLLHFTIAPEVYLDPRKLAAVRFGVQVGWKLRGYATGRTWQYGYPPLSGPYDYEGAGATHFGGDLRGLFALHFQFGSGNGFITVEPYLSAPIGSLLKSEPGSRGNDFGLRLGWAWRMKGRTLFERIDALGQGAQEQM